VPAALLGLALLLAGCASTNPPPPATWLATLPAGCWWLRFDDPGLAALVGQALRANTGVLSARAALRQAAAARDVAAAALGPSLDLSASAQRGTQGGHSTGNSLQAALSAHWVLDLFGARRSALDAQAASLRASTASLADVQLAVATEVALDYIALRSSQARLAIAAENLASQQQTLQLTRWREQAGLVTAVETAQAQAAVAQTGATLPALQTAIAQTRHALAVLVGQPPASAAALPDLPDLRTLLDTPGKLPQAPGDIPLAIPAQALRQRADVRAAEHRVSAALALLDQADAARFPGFALGGSIGVGAASLATLDQRAAVVSSLLASLSVPLFDGGALRAQVRVQGAVVDEARLAHHGAVLVALREVEDALAALAGDQQRQAHLGAAAAAATQAATLARQRYRSGLVDFQTVLETQRTQLGAQDSLAVAQAGVGADQVRLFTALGGGWREEADSGRAHLQHADRGARRPHAHRHRQRHLQPTRTVSIGSELSGTVLRSTSTSTTGVKKGQVLVVLDTAKLRDQILRSQAAVAAAAPGVAQATATKEARANLAAAGGGGPAVGGQVPSGPSWTAAAPRWRAPWPTRPARAGVTDARRRCPPTRPTCPRRPSARRSDGVVLTRAACRPRQRGGRVAAGGDAVHHGRGPGRLRCGSTSTRPTWAGEGRPGRPASPSAPIPGATFRRASRAWASARPSPTTWSPTSPTWTWTTPT
jgi:multidrug efflux system outer membrane protein